MSSRILQPDDGPAAEATGVRWREVRRAERDLTAAGLERELAARQAGIEQEWGQRVQQARAAGLREGEASGRNAAAAELRPVFERLGRSIEELAGLRARLRKEAEADLVKLALAVARRVLRRELAIDPEALHGLIVGALEKLQGQEICRVRVHPAHVTQVQAVLQRPAGEARAGSYAAVEVVPDSSCQPGSIVFETTRGNLDASLESQLQEIERGLADCLRRAS